MTAAPHRAGSPPPKQVTLVTPENASLSFNLAPLASRILALLLDLLIIYGSLLLMFLLMILIFPLAGSETSSLLYALLNLVAFLVRNFYFIFTELQWRGQTVGKRAMKLRIIASDGGPLTAGMIFARNLTREIEVFLPIQLMLMAQSFLGLDSTALGIVTVLWLLTVTLIPFFNKRHARLGDYVAGTLVVAAPEATLHGDLAAATVSSDAAEAPDYQFTTEQLDVYGIHELQVLEEVLRRPSRELDPKLLDVICEKVKSKIKWPKDEWKVNPETFLRAFYTAQRRRLEKEMLFGRRKERKSR
jgi:uncharacterized RDD family membrane protein YckC